jgi:hypothetical protein
MKDPVRGTANVVSASALEPGGHRKHACTMELIVQGEGVSSTTVSHHDGDTPVDRWPNAGDVLPVTVDRDEPEHLRIEWDEVPVRGAISMGVTPTPVAPSTPGAAVEHHSIRDEHPEIPPEAAAIVDQLASMFPGASVNVAEPTVVKFDGAGNTVLQGAEAAAAMAGVAKAFGGDRISQLERLAKLHEEGALTDDEFEAEKRRVLGESGGSASGSDPSSTSG